ncbi:PQQ-binding-like beta-propeller repeat protein [Kitasatospora sp. NPDC036755]|uniref:outer membrane protein assembly factor BamB family protein n=1 Tax=Kitasatospora sp. NPDC036755 TaxID=3154600 RepID=UPI0033DDF29B
MATLPPNRRIELAGANALQALLQDHDHVVYPIDGGADLGEDFLVAFTRDRVRTGRMVAVQVKTAGSRSSKYRRARGYAIPVDDHADDWRNNVLPVVGVVYDMEIRKLFWVNLTKVLSASPATSRWVKVSPENELRAGTIDQFIAEIETYADTRGTPEESAPQAALYRPTNATARTRHPKVRWQVPLSEKAYHPVRSAQWVVVWDPPYLRVIDDTQGKLQPTLLKPSSGQHSVVGDNAVYIPIAGNRLRAFGLPDLKMRWEAVLQIDHALARFTDGTLYVPGRTGGLHALNPADGRPRWRTLLADHPVLAPARLHRGKLIVLGGPAGSRSSDSGFAAGCVLAVDPSDGQTSWSYAPRNPLFPQWGGSEGLLFLVEQTATFRHLLVAVDLITGKEVYRKRLPEPVVGAPVASAAAVHLVDAEGTVHTRDAASGRLRWQHPTQHRTQVAPVPVGDLVVLVSEPRLLVALDAATGAERWRATAPGDFTTTPLEVGGIVYVGHRGGRLLAFEASGGGQVGSGPCSVWEEGERGRPVVVGGTLYITGRYGKVSAISLG